MLGITSEFDEHKGCSGSRIFIFLDTRAFLVHSDFLMIFAEFFAN